MSELSKLKWHCRRGIKELDIVLIWYLNEYYENTHEDDKKAFKELLEFEDPVLYAILLGNVEPANPEQLEVLNRLRNMHAPIDNILNNNIPPLIQ